MNSERKMFNTIKIIEKCILLPYFIILCYLLFRYLFLSHPRRYGLFIIIVFSFAWRAASSVSSSRYCAFFYFFIIICFSLFCKHDKKSTRRKDLLTIILTALLLFNVVSSMSSFRNEYLYDLGNCVRFLKTKNDSIILCEKKDINRISALSNENIVGIGTNKGEIDKDISYDMFNQYKFWEEDAYLLCKEKRNSDLSLMFYTYDSKVFSSKRKKVAQFITNARNKSLYSAYYLPKFYPSGYYQLKERNSETINNILDNGILKSICIQYDTYIFQVDDTLFWIVSQSFTSNPEIIYHIIPHDISQLPKRRQMYGYDNRSFFWDITPNAQRFEDHTVFWKMIPHNYSAATIRSGFGFSKKNKVWFTPFEISPFDTKK